MSYNPPAFPREDYQTDDAPGQSGMSLRDYFAAKVIQGLIARPGVIDIRQDAEFAYMVADALLVERSATQPKEGGE